MEWALVDTHLRELVAGGAFHFEHELEPFVQPASIDLPLAGKCYLVKEKVLPFRRKIEELLPTLVLEERSLGGPGGAVLLKGQTYLFHCGLVSLPAGDRGLLSPKSSIGRVDLMVRGMVDCCGLYDNIPGGLQPRHLWLEVTPRSFNVRVKEGLALTQLMVLRQTSGSGSNGGNVGSAEVAASPQEDGPAFGDMVFDDKGNPVQPHVHGKALVLSLSVPSEQDVVAGHHGPDGVLGYEALPTSEIIDLSRKNHYTPSHFFRVLYPQSSRSSRTQGQDADQLACTPVKLSHDEGGKDGGSGSSRSGSSSGGRLTLEKDRFYILRTKEYVSIPLDMSGEMVPFSHHVGELRAHYAGFFDPGFGYGFKGEIKGTVGVLEVRPHETITVYDGQPICLMEFFRNLAKPAAPYGVAGNSYQEQQGPRLAKFFHVEDGPSSMVFIPRKASKANGHEGAKHEAEAVAADSKPRVAEPAEKRAKH